MLHDLLFRLRGLFRIRQAESELDDELRFHLERQIEKNLRAGMSPDQAARRARIQVGGMNQLKEECRDAGGLQGFQSLRQDLAFAFRMLWKNRAFTLVAVLTLALGVGATTSIFSIVNAVLLHSLPLYEPGRLVRIFFADPAAGMDSLLYSVPELDDLRNRSGVFESVSGSARGSIDMTGAGQPERLEMVIGNPTYFSMLGVTPQIGRVFGPPDFVPGFAPAVVISDDLWHRDFGADPQVLGRTIHLDIDAYQIIGVLPPGFRNPGRTGVHPVDVWLASGFMSASDPKPLRGNRSWPGVLGRLKRGLTLQQAQARLTAMADQIRRENPGDYPPPSAWTIKISPLQENMVGKFRPMLILLLGAVILIVLIVSLNIANLLLARASRRQQEISIRFALGASRRRILSQLLTESLLLASLGGLAGIATAYLTLGTVLRWMPPEVPRLSEVQMSGTVLLFAWLISLLTGLIFGLAPAFYSTRSSAGLREGSRAAGYSAKSTRLRDALIVSEITVAVVLMIGGGLLLRTLRDLLRVDPGFKAAGVVTASVNIPFPNDPKLDPYATLPKQIAFYRELGRRLQSLSGIRQFAFASDLPGSETGFHFTLGIEDRMARGAENLRARHILISPDYFRVMQTPLVRGRYFTESDEAGKPRVAIIDESTARRYWPDRDAVGRRLRMGQGAWMTVVGIVEDMRQEGLDIAGEPQVYVPMFQDFDVSTGYVFRDFCILARTPLAASELEPEIRRQVRAVDPGLPVYNVLSLMDWLDRSLASRRFSARLVSGFAAIALLLASIGIYGLLAYMVGQQSRDIGVRMALGAARADILRPILWRGVLLAGIGTLTGVLISILAASTISSLLYGVHPHDPAVFGTVPLLLLLVAAFASYIPARRATQVDPIIVLRET